MGADGSVHPLHNAGDINRKDNPMPDSTKGNPSPPSPIWPTFIWADGDSPGLYAYPGPEGEESNPSRGPKESRPENRADTDPRELESPQVDPADEFIDALRRLEVLEPTGYSDIVPRRIHVALHAWAPFLRIYGTSPSHDLKEKKARRRAGKCLAGGLVLILVGAAVCTWTGMGAFSLLPGAVFLLLAGGLAAYPGLFDDDFLKDPALTFPANVAGTYEERRSLSQKLIAANSVDRGIFTSALQVLAGESAEEANPEVRERALIVLRDLYLKSEERRLDLDQPQTIEKLTAVATLEARIEMLD